MHSYTFKVIIVGAQRAGKSALLKQMFLGEPLSEAEILSGFGSQQEADGCSKEMKKKEYTIDKDCTVVLEVWDAVGYGGGSLTSQFYRESVGIIFLYDSTTSESLEELRQFEDKCKEELVNFESVVCFLAANKIDDDGSDPANIEFGKQHAIRHKYAAFFQVSAKSGQNVDEMFHQMAESLLDSHRRGAIQPVRTSNSVIVLKSTGPSSNSQKRANCDC